MKQNKLMIIELDGGTWDVMLPLIKAGRLPNIAALMERGAHGVLKSDPPLLSPRLWVSIFSGKRSSEHGVDFFGSTSAMVKCKRLWDICSDRGIKVGVFGSLVTWPPYPVNGFMVPSIFSLGTETYPEEYRFIQELTLGERKKSRGGKESGGRFTRLARFAGYAMQLFRHGVKFSTFIAGLSFMINNIITRPPDDSRFWKKACLHLRISSQLFTHLCQKTDVSFSSIHIHLCDAVAHRYWKYFEPDKFTKADKKLVEQYKNVIPECYIEADRAIGEITAAAGPDTTFIILSDHGCAAMETLRESYKLRFETLLSTLKIERDVIPANVGFMTFLYFHDKKLMTEISGVIEKFTFADDGSSVFDVKYEESLFGIRLAEKLWGTPVEGSRRILMGKFGETTFDGLFSPHKMEVSGTHHIDGFLVVSGPGIKRGVKLEPASIYDITPTSLAIMGMPVARDMHGNVLDGIFESGPEISYTDTYDIRDKQDSQPEEVDVDKVKERLKALGYL